MLFLRAAAAAALAVAAPTDPPATASHTDGHAAPAIDDPQGVMQNFDVARVTPVLDALGVANSVRETDDGDTFIAASIGDQISFNIVPTACLNSNHTRCVGANFIVLFGGPPNRQTVAAFNQRHAFTSAGVVGNNEGVYLLRYEIADYGLPRGNFAASLSAFLHFASLLRAELREGVNTVSLEGYAEDGAAARLNVLGAAALRGEAPPAGYAVGSSEIADALLQAGAPVNPVSSR